MKYGSVCSPAERFLAVIAEPDDRLGPGFPVIGIASRLAPEQGAPLVGEFPRKGSVQPDKPVVNELRYLGVAERAHVVVCIRRHEVLISLGRRPSLREAKQARLIRSSSMSLPVGSRHTHFRPLDTGKALTAEEEDRSDTENADHHRDARLARPPCSINEGSNWPIPPSPARR